MSTGEILDRTFNLYRNNFVLFAGIATLPPAFLLAINVIQAAMGATRASHPRSAGLGVGLVAAGGIGILIGYIAYLVGLAVAQAATVFAVSAVHLGRTTTIGESYHRVKGRYGRVVNVIVSVGIRAFGPALILFLALVALTLIPGGPGVGRAASALMGIGFVIGMLAAGVLAIVLYVRYSLAVQACVLEEIKAKDAIKRSVVLSRGGRGRIFVIYVLMVVMTYIVVFVFLIPATFLAALVAKGSPAVAILATGLATFLAGALAGPIATIALSLVYFDQRVRKEAFDLQLMMAAVDGTPLPGAQAASAG